MTGALSHRGPDDDSTYARQGVAFGSTRLSIVDEKRGWQPVFNEDKSVVAVFNGEIFNHRYLAEQLVKQGHVFRSQCDSEVLVHLYEQYGCDFVQLLEGQFAFAVWDFNRHMLVLVRDRFGICPLFYTQQEDSLYFASEIKAFQPSSGKCRLSDQGFSCMLFFGTSIAPLTMFENIYQLRPGHMLIMKQNSVAVSEYWDLNFPTHRERTPVNPLSARKRVAHRIKYAVRRTVQTDKAVGIFLSGGIDSSAIAAEMGRGNVENVHAYSISSYDKRYDESNDVNQFCKDANIALTQITIDKKDLSHAFPDYIWHGETPVFSTEGAGLMLLAQEAGKKAKIVLSGEGADEAFAGYRCFRWYLMHGARNSLTWLTQAVRHFAGDMAHRYVERKVGAFYQSFSFFPAQIVEYASYWAAACLVLRRDYLEYLDRINVFENLGWLAEKTIHRHWLDRSLYCAYRVMLANYLLGPHSDRVLMRNSLEGRYPFLDQQLVEYSTMIPPQLKLNALQSKAILRSSLNRTLPAYILRRPKRRFMLPFGSTFLNQDKPNQLSCPYLDIEQIENSHIFDACKIKKCIALYNKINSCATQKTRAAEVFAFILGEAITLVVSFQLFNQLFLSRNKYQV